jgi:Cof subfamily protein (haloacid dehalogenase superfamily)
MRKLFATDLDGTLVENHTTISDDNIKQIERLKAQNHILAIATGRGYDHVALIQERYNMDVDYLILLNGALIIDKHSQVIRHSVIPNETIEEIINEFYNEEWEAYFSTGFKGFRFSKHGESSSKSGRSYIENTEDLKEEKISIVGIKHKKENIELVEEICKKINSKFGDVVTAYRNVSYIDIVPAGCSKGNGIDYVKKKENIKDKNAYAIGDSWNDATMFDSVENSFTFERAEKELQRRAKYIVETVAECIGKYVLDDAS